MRTQFSSARCGQTKDVGLAGNALSAIDLLKSARAVGITVTLDNDTVVLEGPAEPPRDQLDEFRRQKAYIVASCSPRPNV